MSRRLYWVGDLKRDYYVAFQLVNIQRDDAGDYGVKLRVDNYPRPPLTLNSWFTLKVEVRKNNLIVFLHAPSRRAKRTESVYKIHIVRHRILLCSDNQTICTLLSDR